MGYPRQTWWDYKHSMTYAYGDKLAGCPYSEELAGPDGMHYHVWVPVGTSAQERSCIAEEIRRERDMVSMSWDYLTPEVSGYSDEFVEATMDALRLAMKEGRIAKLCWPDGEHSSLDLFSVSALVGVHDALNEENQKRYTALLKKGATGLLKMVDMAFKLINSSRT